MNHPKKLCGVTSQSQLKLLWSILYSTAYMVTSAETPKSFHRCYQALDSLALTCVVVGEYRGEDLFTQVTDRSPHPLVLGDGTQLFSIARQARPAQYGEARAWGPEYWVTLVNRQPGDTAPEISEADVLVCWKKDMSSYQE